MKCTRKQPKNHSGPQQRNEYKRKLNMQNEQRERHRGRDRERGREWGVNRARADTQTNNSEMPRKAAM